MESVATVETRCKASALPPRLGSLRLPHFPQPRRRIYFEQLWRSLKYEAVYLHDLADGFQARRVIGEWIDFYNAERPHSALGGKTPAEAYRGDPPADMMDKPLRALPTYPQAQQRRQEDRSKEILAR